MTDDEMLYHREVAKLEDEVGRLRSLVSDQAAKLRELRDECHELERERDDFRRRLQAYVSDALRGTP